MKQNIATDREQSKRLLACGVKPETADMEWQPTGLKDDYRLNVCLFLADAIPAWSLVCLLALLPTSLTSALGNEYMLELSKLRMHDAWEIQWYNGRERWRTCDKDKKFRKLWDKSPIEACVKAIEWMTANGYSLNNIEQ